KDKLIANKEAVYLSRELATINTAVPIDCTLSELEFNEVQGGAFYQKLRELEFRRMSTNFKWEAGAEEQQPQQTDNQTLVFGAQDRIVLDNVDDLQKELDNAKKAGIISFNYGKQITFAYDKTEYSIEISEDMFGEGLDIEDAMAMIGAILASDILKICYDVKSIKHALKIYGISICAPYEDVALKDYLDDANRVSKSASELLDRYNCSDIAVGQLCYNKHIDSVLAEKDLVSLYRDIELPLIEVLYDMEVSGFTIDKSVLNALSEKFSAELIALTENIRRQAGDNSLNINSPKQIGQLLFEKLELAHGKKNKTSGYSVSAEVLETLDHPIVSQILRYRKIGKLQSTYITGMLGVIDNRTERCILYSSRC
ncbi:MAG: DNA polymerase, partial [Bacillota bacterium]